MYNNLSDRLLLELVAKSLGIQEIPTQNIGGGLMGDGSTKPWAPPPPAEKTPLEKAEDAYWASQPEHLKVFRGLDTESAIYRAQQLLSLSIPVDNEIMVHDMNPYTTMLQRKNLGYTWYPAFGQSFQSLVPAAPGITLPNGKFYDALNPPPGTIKVDLTFAVGIPNLPK